MTGPHTGYPFLDGPDGERSVLALAHRGGARHPDLVGLENTRTAFRHAARLGYRYLETDVHATRDGVLMAFHDAVLDRVTDRTGAIADLPYAEVAEARIHGREQIPTLSSLLEEFPDHCFNIDVKAEPAVAPLAELVRRTGREDSVCVGSFSDHRLRRFRRLAGARVATSAGPFETALVRLAPTAGLARLARTVFRSRSVALQVPPRRKGFTVLTRGLLHRAHALGLPVHAWTVDDADEMHRLLDLGVDGLVTDRTDVLRDVLRSRGLWTEASR